MLLVLALAAALTAAPPARAAGPVTFGSFSVIPNTLLPSDLTPFGSQLAFTVDQNRVAVTDGETTSTLRDFRPLSCGSPGPHDLSVFKSSVLFGGGQTDDELWRTSGSASGTGFVRNIDTGHTTGSSECPLHSHPAGFATLGGWTHFAATVHSRTGRELWRTNGTTTGTALVRDIAPGTPSSAPAYITPWTSYAYFSAATPSAGRELWKTNGTAAGTRMVRNIRPGRGSSGPTWITQAGGKMFFTATDGPHGRELWRTNGTYTGTVMVRDIAHGAAASSPNHLVVAGGVLYFLADDGVHGEQLWKSDGTAAGTVMVDYLGPGSKNVTSLVAVGTRLYFAASTPNQGNALWTSLGTAATTHLVAHVGVGADTIAGVAGVAMFAGNDGTHGLEPWVSDGTAAGTHMLADIWPGSESSLPRRFTYAGGRVYFLDSYDAYLWTATVTTP